MADLDRHGQQKEKILLTMKVKGPCLPVQIAKVLNVSPLFASAFLSELKAEDKVKISDMKVGSSPLYYLPGQEILLENFVKFLNQREREAFQVLKQNHVLEDEKQAPVIRVALRAIKDFAVPFSVTFEEKSRIFWKHFAISDEETDVILNSLLLPSNKVKTSEIKSEETEKVEASELKEEVKKIVLPVEKKKKSVSSELSGESHGEDSSKISSAKPVRTSVESEFGKNVINFLNGKEIELLEKTLEKKKEFEGRVRVDTLFGKQEFYLIAKDKKSATDNDLAIAWQKAQSIKLPALVMTTGDLNKKAKEHLNEWGNLIKFEKITF